MDKIRAFKLANVGKTLRIQSGPGVPGGSNGRYQIRISDIAQGTSHSYSASLEEMRKLNHWLQLELYFRATGIDRSQHD